MAAGYRFEFIENIRGLRNGLEMQCRKVKSVDAFLTRKRIALFEARVVVSRASHSQ